jgi:hypothetical protein
MPELVTILPRLVRLRDAPRYLGLDRNVFNRDVRPELVEIRHGRAVLFDRMELDAWADYTKRAGVTPRRDALLHREGRQDSTSVETSGISGNGSEVTAGSMRALVRQIRRKPSAT